MSGYEYIWVKVNEPETDLPLLREQYHVSVLSEGARFACAAEVDEGGESPADTLQALSNSFGEAIFMSVQTTVDFFLYSHWRDGELLREITYCADEGWYELQGEKQAWEQRLFSENERLRQLSYLDLDHLAKNPNTAEYDDAQRLAAQISTVWTAKELIEDSFYPMATASELYYLVMRELSLTNPY